MTRREAREHLFCMLFRTEFYSQEEFAEQLELYTIYSQEIVENDKEVLKHRFQQVLNHIEEIDQMIEKFSEGWRMNRMGKVEVAILRLAIFEMKFDEDIPVGVAINEAVELAKKYGDDHSFGFVNGILAKIVGKE